MKNTPRQTRCTRSNVEKYNDRLGVDMNIEHFLTITDKAENDVKKQARKVRRDHSFR